jgi:hypothetical protein
MNALNKIDVKSVYNEERRGFGPLRVPKMYPKPLPSVETNENNEILFIDKIKRAARSGVRSNAGCAFDRTPTCVRSSDVRSAAVASQCHVRSSVGICVRTYCVRPQITALKSHGASKLAMAARATRTSWADKECVQM